MQRKCRDAGFSVSLGRRDVLSASGIGFPVFIRRRSRAKYGGVFDTRDAPHPAPPPVGSRGYTLGPPIDRADQPRCRISRATARYRAGRPIRGREARKTPLYPAIYAPRRVGGAPGLRCDPTRPAVCGLRRYMAILASCGHLRLLWNLDVRAPEEPTLPGTQWVWPGGTLKVLERGANYNHDPNAPRGAVKNTKGVPLANWIPSY